MEQETEKTIKDSIEINFSTQFEEVATSPHHPINFQIINQSINLKSLLYNTLNIVIAVVILDFQARNRVETAPVR